MPYGIPEKYGGDSKKNVKWIENCIKSVKEENPNYSKTKAIRICKVKFIEMKKDK
jgi:hypothetical protein